MNNNIIQQALAELENSLSKLDSARNQVTSVSKKSEDLVKVFSEILIALEKFESGEIISKDEIIKNFKNSLSQFESHVTKASADFTKKTSGLSETVSYDIENLKNSIHEAENNLHEFQKIISTTNHKIESIDFTKELKDIIVNFEKQFTKFDNNQTYKVSNLNKQIETGFLETDKQIKSIDFTKEVSKIINELEIQLNFIKNSYSVDLNNFKNELTQKIKNIESLVKKAQTESNEQLFEQGKKLENLEVLINNKVLSAIYSSRNQIVFTNIGLISVGAIIIFLLIKRWFL